MLLAILGLLIGGMFGAIAQRGYFCTMGAVSDLVLFGSLRRLRVWALASGTAVLGTQALLTLGLIRLENVPYLSPDLFWLGAGLGGLLLGLGMVQAGGCPSRNLVRLGTGSLKALFVVLILGLSALLVTTGPLGIVRQSLMAVGSLHLPAASQGLDAVLRLIGMPQATARPLALVILGLPLLLLGLSGAQPRREPLDLVTGIGLGATIPLAWLATSLLDPSGPHALSYVEPTGHALVYLMAAGSTLPGFAVASISGVVLGAAVMAGVRRQFRLETFASRDDMLRHCRGAVLMGVGGALAFGCTVGQGMSGLSTLSLHAVIATVAMVLGATWGVKQLETGSFLPRLRPAASEGITATP